MEETNVINCDTTENVAKKPTYEELENAARELYAHCERLTEEIQRMKVDNTFKRLDYLFKVLEHGNILSENFIKECVCEIEEIMTIPKTELQKED